MNSIFISYRRQDSAGFTHALGKKLAERYGKDSIFRDLEDIEAGDDFVVEIEEAVSSCSVLIAVIGPHWSNIKNKQGMRRLENPDDFVRLEIESALKRDISVLPVTVNGAVWPPIEELPESMQRILRHQAHDLSDRQGRWDYDVEQLMARLDKLNGITAISPSEFSEKPEIRKLIYKPKLMLGLGAAIIGVLGIFIFSPDPKPVLVIDLEEATRKEGAGTAPVETKNVVSITNKTLAAGTQEPRKVVALASPLARISAKLEVKFFDISGSWIDRWGAMYYIKMIDKTHFVAITEEVRGEGVINGQQIEFTALGGGYGKYHLSNLGNHISGKYYESANAEGEDVVLMRVK